MANGKTRKEMRKMYPRSEYRLRTARRGEKHKEGIMHISDDITKRTPSGSTALTLRSHIKKVFGVTDTRRLRTKKLDVDIKPKRGKPTRYRNVRYL